jgi:CotH kinase protein
MPDDTVTAGPPDVAEPERRPSRRSGLFLVGLTIVASLQAADVIRGTANPGFQNGSPERFRARRRAFAPRAEFGTPRQGPRVTPDEVKRYSDAPLYDTATLRTIFLQFQSANWEHELASRYRGEVETPATVTIDGTVYRDVGVHFRGNSSYRMVPEGLKHSLNLAFDYKTPDQHVRGYRTLNLLNANGDPTFVRAVLYSEIARSYLPTPRANFVRVVINGESWGIYVNLQQFNKDFLRDFYGTTKGARWKVPGSPRGRAGLEYLGDSVGPYRALYEIKTKDHPKAWADLVRLCRLLNTTAPEHLEAVLSPHLDLETTLKFLALDVALVNTDGYWMRASDYSIYQDDKGRFHILPYDFNEAMGVAGGGWGRRGAVAAGPSLDPLVGIDDPSKPLRSKLLAVPALRQRYLAHVRHIAQTWLDWKRVDPLVRQFQDLIAADVKVDGRKLYGVEAFNTVSLENFFSERRAFLLR